MSFTLGLAWSGPLRAGGEVKKKQHPDFFFFLSPNPASIINCLSSLSRSVCVCVCACVRASPRASGEQQQLFLDLAHTRTHTHTHNDRVGVRVV